MYAIPDSETSITYFPQFNIHRPMINYSKPQSGKFAIDPKTGYFKALPPVIDAPSYRLRTDRYGDVWCPECGLIYNNDDYDGYFVKSVAVEPIDRSPGNDINYSKKKENHARSRRRL